MKLPVVVEGCSGIYVPPEIPRDPNIILVGESPGVEEQKQGKPFVGKSGQIIRGICQRTGARPVIVNSRNYFTDHKPTTEEINASREAHLLPILGAFPHLPIVGLGAYAAQALAGGKRGGGKNKEKEGATSMAGKVIELYGRPALFTYHPAYYLYEGRDERILEHIEAHVLSALQPMPKPRYALGFGLQGDEIVVDVETDSEEYPWYGSGVVILGVMSLGYPPRIVPVKEITPAIVKELNKKIKKVIGHNLMFDLVHLAVLGITFDAAEFHDTMIYSKNTGTGGDEISLALKYQAKKLLRFPPYEAKFHRLLADGVAVKEMPKEVLYPYNARDLYATEGLLGLQNKPLPGFELDMDYMRPIRDMIVNGLCFSRRKLSLIGTQVHKDLLKAQTQARKIAGLGKDFNFNSPQQVRAMLEHCGVKVSSTEADVLEEVKDQHPIVEKLLEIRELQTLYTRGVEGIRKRLV